jgi:sulfide dehydrogenase cytochrome subunit
MCAVSANGQGRGTSIAALSVVAFLVTPVTAQSAEPNGLIGTCSVCHGADLTGSGAVPPLKGHNAEYINRALDEFRAGQRPATVMTRLMRGFSNSDIEALAQQVGAMK